MKPFLVALPFVLLSSCQSAEQTQEERAIAACEEQLVSRLKAPSTYKRIRAEGMDLTEIGDEAYMVVLEYDAENSFSALLRDTEYCTYPIKNGIPITSEMIEITS